MNQHVPTQFHTLPITGVQILLNNTTDEPPPLGKGDYDLSKLLPLLRKITLQDYKRIGLKTTIVTLTYPPLLQSIRKPPYFRNFIKLTLTIPYKTFWFLEKSATSTHKTSRNTTLCTDHFPRKSLIPF